MRYVAPSRLRKDENNNVIGILGAAFQLREDEEGLSTTWIEYFPGTHQQQVEDAVHILRSSIIVRPKSGFAIGKVADILSACNLRKMPKKTKIIYMPTPNNTAHAEVRSMPYEDQELLDLLAAETWSELIMNANIP